MVFSDPAWPIDNLNSMTEKKSVWITGASSGLGEGLARALIGCGHFVILSGRNQNRLSELCAIAPERVVALDFDLANAEHFQQLEQRIAEITEVLDQVILAAGVCEYVDSPDCGDALYRRVMEVNFFAQVQLVNLALPMLKRSELGPQIVALGSLATRLAFPRAEAYGASKAAFEYWLDCLRIDLDKQIDITLVSPGFVDTPLTRKNDFAMPSLMPVQRAVPLIVNAIEKRKRHLRFPKRLYWGLLFLAFFETIWFTLAPRLTGQRRL